MDFQQAINFAILDALRERDIDLLFPSLAVKVTQEDTGNGKVGNGQ